jgi:4-carboxymuconolactone decarboxylase
VLELGKISDLPADARETAILAVGAHYRADYEIYAHERLAVGTGLTKPQIDAIKTGIKPPDLNEGCNAAFDATEELMKKPGPLGDENWNRAVKAFGKKGALTLVHYVGFYAYTCLLLNGCAIKVPEGEKIL